MMDRRTFEQTVHREIQQTLDELLPQHSLAGNVSRQELHHHLKRVSERVQEASRDYYLDGLVTADDMADELGVSVDHLRDLAQQRHFNYGMGRKIGDMWVWTQDEVDVILPNGE
jgi:hypothetical protein